MRVLVAEDSAPQRFMLEDMLTDWGYDVVCAADGEEAWDVIRGGEPPEVAILDWEMPGMDGIEVCRKAKSEANLPYLYIIMVTARTAKTDVVTGLDAGADDYVRKPVDPDELRSRLSAGIRVIEYERVLIQKSTALQIFSQAFEHSIQGIYITDTGGGFLRVNPAFAAKYGYTEAEVVGKDHRILDPGREGYADLGVAAEKYEELYAGLAKAIADPTLGHWQGTLANRTKGDSIVWTQTHISAIRDDSGGTIGYVGTPVDISDRVEEEYCIRIECYRAITDLAEARDNETGLHLKRLGEFSRLVAVELGVPRKYVNDIATFAPLHDIGKVGIPDDILLGPRSLTDAEFELMKSHTAIGHKILKERATLEMAADIAYTHHEKY